MVRVGLKKSRAAVVLDVYLDSCALQSAHLRLEQIRILIQYVLQCCVENIVHSIQLGPIQFDFL